MSILGQPFLLGTVRDAVIHALDADWNLRRTIVNLRDDDTLTFSFPVHVPMTTDEAREVLKQVMETV